MKIRFCNENDDNGFLSFALAIPTLAAIVIAGTVDIVKAPVVALINTAKSVECRKSKRLYKNTEAKISYAKKNLEKSVKAALCEGAMLTVLDKMKGTKECFLEEIPFKEDTLIELIKQVEKENKFKYNTKDAIQFLRNSSKKTSGEDVSIPAREFEFKPLENTLKETPEILF